MADMAINLNATQNTIDKEGWNDILELVSKVTAAQDNLLKSVNTTNDALKGMQNNLSQETGIASVTSEETSGASGSLVEWFSKNLDTLRKSLEGFDPTKTLMDLTTPLLDTTMIGSGICVLGSHARITSVLTN